LKKAVEEFERKKEEEMKRILDEYERTKWERIGKAVGLSPADCEEEMKKIVV
jgi:hypothetical protein